MTPAQLAGAAVQAIAAGRKDVQLVVPREPRGDRIRLFGRLGGPLSTEIACVSEGRTVAWYDAVEVVGWLKARGLVVVEVDEDNMVRITSVLP